MGGQRAAMILGAVARPRSEICVTRRKSFRSLHTAAFRGEPYMIAQNASEINRHLHDFSPPGVPDLLRRAHAVRLTRRMADGIMV